MNEHEQAFVAAFVLSERRERYFSLLSSVKRRAKFRLRIAHHLVHDLDSRYLYSEDNLPEEVSIKIRRLLEHLGQLSVTSYIMCEDSALDGQEMTLGKAEAEWDALCGIIISVIPGKLVYYRPERPNENYVLLKVP
jgi:hypothetical protein